MKKAIAVLCLIVIVVLTAACGKSDNQMAEATTTTESFAVADGYAELGGLWKVGAIYYNNKLIDVNDVSGLKDLYDSTFLLFSEDGTFIYFDVYLKSGTYKRLSGADTFLLKTNRVYRLKVVDGSVKEEDSIDGEKPTYLISLVSGDSNSLQFDEYDAITGKAKAGTDPVYFVKTNEESVYINDQKYNISDLLSSRNTETEQEFASTQEHTTTAIYHVASIGERNAVQKAKDYIDYKAFSYSGLVEQLEYEGFTKTEAEYGAANCGADWYEQAVRKAQEYLDYTSFSRQGLIDQLEYEGFTSEEAQYGVNQVY